MQDSAGQMGRGGGLGLKEDPGLPSPRVGNVVEEQAWTGKGVGII